MISEVQERFETHSQLRGGAGGKKKPTLKGPNALMEALLLNACIADNCQLDQYSRGWGGGGGVSEQARERESSGAPW